MSAVTSRRSFFRKLFASVASIAIAQKIALDAPSVVPPAARLFSDTAAPVICRDSLIYTHHVEEFLREYARAHGRVMRVRSFDRIDEVLLPDVDEA